MANCRLQGASTIDRNIAAIAKLGNGQTIDGANGKASSTFCAPASLSDVDVKGKVVLCERGGNIGRIDKGQEVKDNGGAAMILMNDKDDGFSTLADPHVLPAKHWWMTENEICTAVSSPSPSDLKLTIDSQVPVSTSSCAASGPDMVASDSRKAKHVRFDIDETVGSETAKTISPGKDQGGTLILYHSSVLKDFTRNFDSDTLIGLTQFGRLYRGKIETAGEETRFVTLKTWDERVDRFMYNFNYKRLIMEEVKILTHPSLKHPNLVKLIGVCYDKQVKAIVYDLNPLDTLHNYMSRGGHGQAYKWGDVLSVGLILVELITKRITNEDELRKGVKTTRDWAKGEYKPGFSLVCQSLQNQAGYDPSDGLMITELAMQCIKKWPPERPVIETVVESLEKLSVVKSHAGLSS
ncbi:hypothetical protein COLO4_27658 [Corchorus olitorius]|uniref:Protein kinase domain-containing protein n=1 Tax=Corchorus olitorius TaxID=93759 RepID=A0A1R3HPY9_9ROSI|nr:hypothetical protein COLO4_27658 [Corchorus olitorius]